MSTLSKFNFLLLIFILLSMPYLPYSRAQTDGGTSFKGPRVRAPEFKNAKWLNSRPLSMSDLKGKIVLLDFWTYGCINCMNAAPGLHRLEEEFKEDLVVIGVHSAKFDKEKNERSINKAMLRLGLEHLVINDDDFTIWESYGVKSWPTFVLIDPNGYLVGQHAGEDFYQSAREAIQKIKRFQADDLQSNKKIKIAARPHEKIMKFPSGIAVKGDTVYIADSGNHRILVQDKTTGKLLNIIGRVPGGFKDGSSADARFNFPQGLLIDGDDLYVADTRNHALRKIALDDDFKVTTLAGDGQQGWYSRTAHWDGTPVSPSSPWGITKIGKDLIVSSAGNHQVLRYDLSEQKLLRLAGAGMEALLDGPLQYGGFCQPSGLATDGQQVFVADAEASAIRIIDFKERKIKTLIGKGLFEFGDQDGKLNKALLQHVSALAFDAKNQILYLADSYNGKIKEVNLKKARVTTILSELFEPNALYFEADQQTLWVGDTNAHRILKINLETFEKEVFPLLR